MYCIRNVYKETDRDAHETISKYEMMHVEIEIIVLDKTMTGPIICV